MRKELLKSVMMLLMFVLLSQTIMAQDSPNSLGPAPLGSNVVTEISPVFTDLNANSRGFGTNSTGLTSATLFKFFLGTPGSITSIGAAQAYFWCGAIFAGSPATIYAIQQISPYSLHTLDTVTGAMTNLGAITGILPGHSSGGITGFTYDYSSQTAYVISSSLSQTQLYSFDIATRVATPIGSPSTVCAGGITLSAAPNGSLFAVDLVADNLYKFDKTTGVATLRGPLGYNANYGQTAEFDQTDGILYWAAIGQTQPSQLRTVDTTTGASTLIGVFTATSQVTALTIPYIAGPAITHTPLPNTENTAGPYVVNCVITPAGSPINPALTRLFWSRNNTNITDSLLMTNTSGNNWTGNIPGNSTAATYRYYIKTADMLGRVSTHPGGAPGNLHMFTAGPDNIKPVIVHTPLPGIPKPNWPATVTATITDNIGIDSGWVRWYKFTVPGTVKHFKLTNTGGNTYSAAFNSTQAEVNFGDSILYRIIAQDNSSNHNKDSTALFGFKILAIANPCIGTGTTAAAWPYNTFWHDSRTQMLYTAAEITTGGGSAGNITKIGFNVTSAAPQVMNQFSIKMQNTTATSITAFVTTGWTNVYTGTYAVPGTGWQFVTLQNQFAYNGTDNLLVEICFDNTSYTSATSVNSSAVTNMCREQHTDNAAGCSFTAGTNVTRPNICMEVLLPVGKPTINTEVPKIYSLEQNYPNPFNPVTNIKYSVPKQSLVKMVIYDVLGREVTTLVNEMKKPGNYAVPFDASSLASGVYFYRMEAGDFTDVKKMVLLK